MTDEELVAIKERNIARRMHDDGKRCEKDCCWWHRREMCAEDVDTLIAEVERLRRPLLCLCTYPPEAHVPAFDGLWYSLLPAFGGTAHAMVLRREGEE